MSLLRKINWTNTLFLTITPIVGIVGTVLMAIHHLIHWQTILLAFVFIFFTGMSITAGYHRLFSHLTYKAKWPIRLFFLLFGAAAFEGSLIEWCTDHRNHHRYTDTEKDPYNIKRGFWYAHIGWLFVLDSSKRDYSNVEDLQKDPLVRLQHRFYLPIAITMGFLLPMAIAGLWGGWLAGFIVAGALRITLNQHFTFFINSICHLWGKQKYSERISARDNWFTAFLTYGEGYHNFHHQFPLDYRNGIRKFDYDPTKWLIKGLRNVSLAWDLKTVSQQRIVQYQIRNEQEQLQKHSSHSEALVKLIQRAINPARDKVIHALNKVEEVEKLYGELKLKGHHIKDKITHYDYQQRLKVAKKELKVALVNWNTVLRQTKQMMAAA